MHAYCDRMGTYRHIILTVLLALAMGVLPVQGAWAGWLAAAPGMDHRMHGDAGAADVCAGALSQAEHLDCCGEHGCTSGASCASVHCGSCTLGMLPAVIVLDGSAGGTSAVLNTENRAPGAFALPFRPPRI